MSNPLSTQELKDRLDESLAKDRRDHLKRPCGCMGDTHRISGSNATVGLAIGLQARTGTYYDVIMGEALERISMLEL